MMDRAQLADFLRRRREALQPEDVGAARGARRRAPGLRREEVAALSGMSVDYYSRLEQQRGPQPSPQMIAAIAQGLRLSPDERDHLFRLAGHGVPPRAQVGDHVSPALMRVIDRLDDTPAQVMTDFGVTLAQTRLAVALFGDQTRFTGLARSWVFRWFTDPTSRRVYPEAEHAMHSRVFVSLLRASLVRRRTDPRATAIVERLYADSPEFVALWDAHEVGVTPSDQKNVVHPELGLLELQCQVLLARDQSQTLLVFTATPGSESDEKLQRLSMICSQRLRA